MSKVKIGIIGVGNMGGKYAAMLAEGQVPDLELKALTRVKDEKRREIEELLVKSGRQKEDVTIYPSADDLFEAAKSGELVLDAVLIATPHYAHQEQTVTALKLGLHVLCDKPAGVYIRQGR